MLTSDGKELLDQTPIAIPIGYQHPPTLQEQIRRMIRSEQYQALMASGEVESLEEADDFDVEDDDMAFYSPWELSQDQEFSKVVQEATQEADSSVSEAPPVSPQEEPSKT